MASISTGNQFVTTVIINTPKSTRERERERERVKVDYLYTFIITLNSCISNAEIFIKQLITF